MSLFSVNLHRMSCPASAIRVFINFFK